jgi:hypothetical protein
MGVQGGIAGEDTGIHCWWEYRGTLLVGMPGYIVGGVDRRTLLVGMPGRVVPRKEGAHDEAEQRNILKFAQTASGTVMKLARRQGDIVRLVKFYAAR